MYADPRPGVGRVPGSSLQEIAARWAERSGSHGLDGRATCAGCPVSGLHQSPAFPAASPIRYIKSEVGDVTRRARVNPEEARSAVDLGRGHIAAGG
jgi:hypothetical protein